MKNHPTTWAYWTALQESLFKGYQRWIAYGYGSKPSTSKFDESSSRCVVRFVLGLDLHRGIRWNHECAGFPFCTGNLTWQFNVASLQNTSFLLDMNDVQWCVWVPKPNIQNHEGTLFLKCCTKRRPPTTPLGSHFLPWDLCNQSQPHEIAWKTMKGKTTMFGVFS